MSTNGELPQNLPLFLTDADVAKLVGLGRGDPRPSAPPTRPPTTRRGRRAGSSPRQHASGCGSCRRCRPAASCSAQSRSPGPSRTGSRVSYLISLFDKDTADLVALVDGNRVTGLRTAATTAVGTSTIVPQRPLMRRRDRLGLRGAFPPDGLFPPGRVRRHPRVQSHPCQPRGLCPRVRRRSRRAGTSLSARPSEAAEGADLILCAARSRDESPTLLAEWVGPNAAVVSIGSTTPAQRELPAELIARAARRRRGHP